MSETSKKETRFLPYQARWITDTARLKLMEKSRQIGLSWATAYSIVRRKAQVDAALDAWVSSRDDIQARLFLEDCKSFAGIMHAGAQDLGEVVMDPEKKISAYVMSFANGLRIHSMSSNPDAQAGKRGDRVLDEFALNPDSRKLYAIAYPGITWGGQLEIVSTHRGSNSLFNELVNEIKHKGNPKGFSLHTVTLQDALDQGFLDKLKAKLPQDDERQAMDVAEYFDFIRAGCPDDETFQQEYMCNPSDDNGAFLSYDLISSCEYKHGDIWEQPINPAGEYYLGVDVGRSHDLTVLWLVEKLGGVYHTRRLISLFNTPFAAQETELYTLLENPAIRRCCIDNTGIGLQFTERAQKLFGEYRVEAVTFTGPVKEALAYPLRAAFEDKSIRIPNDDKIRSDLRAIKKETTAAGNIRFTADRSKNGHSDRFWALALALHAGSNQAAVGSFRRVKSTRVGRAVRSRRRRACAA